VYARPTVPGVGTAVPATRPRGFYRDNGDGTASSGAYDYGSFAPPPPAFGPFVWPGLPGYDPRVVYTGPGLAPAQPRGYMGLPSAQPSGYTGLPPWMR
jgi:hypothetical protein